MNQTEEQRLKAAGPLQGTTILDLANETASFTTRLLCDLGALVIRVEPPGTEPEDMTFLYHNAGKKRITLNLEREEGRQLLLQLAQQADVMLETFAPGYLTARGITYERLCRENHGLILVSVTGFGLNGRRCDEKSNDLTLSAWGGAMFVSGEAGRPPLRMFGSQTEYTASLYAAISVILALMERRNTGHGRHIDLSTQETVVSALDHVLPRYLYQDVVAKRQGSLAWHKGSFLLPCVDGELLVNLSAAQWDTLVEWVDGEGLAADLAEPQWKDETFRQAHVEHIIQVLSHWTGSHTVKEMFEIAQLMHFAWTPVVRPEDVLSSPQMLERGGRDFETTTGRRIPTPGMPYRSKAFPIRVSERLAQSGEQNEELYCGVLHLTPEELERMRKERLI